MASVGRPAGASRHVDRLAPVAMGPGDHLGWRLSDFDDERRALFARLVLVARVSFRSRLRLASRHRTDSTASDPGAAA
jgi:hypothetical protein